MEYPFFTVFQPVVDLESLEPIGYEALTRFADGQSPLDGIDAAYLGGRGLDLDMVMAEAAVDSARLLPRGAWLALNITPALADHPDHLAALVETATCPLVFEVTDALDGTNPAARLLRDLSEASVSMDYQGARHGGLSRIESVQPTFIKLQRETVADIDDDEPPGSWFATSCRLPTSTDAPWSPRGSKPTENSQLCARAESGWVRDT